MEPVLSSIGELSREAAQLLQKSEEEMERTKMLAKLGQLIEMNQGLLECLGVSHASIRQVINSASPFPTKLTGAGGGGCVFTLLTDNLEEKDKTELSKSMERHNFRCFEVNVGGDGLLIDWEE
jgi:mevalonate kinase